MHKREKIKGNCPYCKKKNTLTVVEVDYSCCYAVICQINDGCMACGPYRYTRKDAIEAFNNRT